MKTIFLPATGNLCTGPENDSIAAFPDSFMYSLLLNPVHVSTLTHSLHLSPID